MKYIGKDYPLRSLSLVIALLMLVNLSCKQDELGSPLPGIIEVRLKTISNDILFSPDNNFVLKVSSVEAIRSDGARVVIYEDLRAIKRTSNIYNTLDPRARDSAIVMGQTYAPPASYRGINIQIEPASSVILDGYRIIDVERPEAFNATLQFRSPFSVTELQTTGLVLTVDLDSTLQKKANSYLFQPIYYISSIK